LSEFSGSIEKYFEENPPQSISEAAAKIEELTGIKRGETQVGKFLGDRKFRFRRVGTVPAKAQTEGKKRAERISGKGVRTWFGRGKKRERVVYFADAVHFVHGAFVACLWCLTRIFIPTTVRS
jgi:hypothetical protein